MTGLSFVALVLAGCGIRSPAAPSNQTRTPESASPTQTPTTVPARSSASPVPVDDTPVCVLTPQATEGPFYFDPIRVRQDIVEDRAGARLRMAIRVMSMDEGCTPLKDALVDLWHADAGGLYSGYPRQLGGQGHVRSHVSSRSPGYGPQWPCPVRHHLSRLVPRPHGPYPFQDPLQRPYICDFPSSIFRTSSPTRSTAAHRTATDPSGRLATRMDSVLRGDPAEWKLLSSVREDGDGYFGTITVGVTV